MTDETKPQPGGTGEGAPVAGEPVQPKAKGKAQAEGAPEPKVTAPVIRVPEQKPMKAADRKAVAAATSVAELKAAVQKIKPEERDAQAIYEATERLMAPTLAKGR